MLAAGAELTMNVGTNTAIHRHRSAATFLLKSLSLHALSVRAIASFGLAAKMLGATVTL